MSAVSTQSLTSLLEEAAMPILIGSLAGGTCGILIWSIAAARFGLTGWVW